MKNVIDVLDRVCFEGSNDQLASRERSFFVRGYVSHKDLLSLFSSADHYAYVWHDRDNKEPHCHFIIRYMYNKTPTAFAKLLKGVNANQNWYFSCTRDKYCAFDYLLHRDQSSIEKGKFRYSESDIICDDINYFTRGGYEALADLKTQAFYNDLVINQLPRHEMALKYGRDYIKNIRSYEESRKLIMQDIHRQELSERCEDFIKGYGGDVVELLCDLIMDQYERILKWGVCPSYKSIEKELIERLEKL